MLTKFLILCCAFAAVCAYSYEMAVPDQELHRVRRQEPPTPNPNWPQLQGQGGGSRKDGFDVHLDARVPVWESDNKRHSFDATGGYSQHLGGPWGNSQPDYRAGGVYTYRW